MASEPTNNTIKILEHSHVSPPPGSVPPTKLPLTFLDYFWLMVSPIKRLFFFNLPQPPQHLIPNLKHSLSLTLRHFFPLAATLRLPPPPQKPYFLYSDDSFVSLTVAESSADFNRLSANYARDVKELHPFVPKLPDADSQPSDQGPTFVVPLLALQVTIFPNFGFCIGYAISHVAADGRSAINFMKSWASICKNIETQELTSLDALLEQAPLHDRGVIKNPSVIEASNYLESTYSWAWNCMKDKTSLADLGPPIDGLLVRATLVMGRAHIERLKVWVSAQLVSAKEAQALHVSSFVATSAFMWVHLVKSRAIGVQSREHEGDAMCYLLFLADCRNRKGFEFLVPATYFGICLALCVVKIKKSDLVGENGLFVAAKAIATKIKELENGALREVDKWVPNMIEAINSGNSMTVASSPNLHAYDVDFGWGRPKKTEITHIDISGIFSLSESGEEKGGVEIGVALHTDKMDAFVVSFEQELKLLLN